MIYILTTKSDHGEIMRKSIISLLLALLLLPAVGQAEERPSSMLGNMNLSFLTGFNVGLGGSILTSEYKGMNGGGTAIPLLGYEGKYLYLRGVAGGVHIFKNEWLEFNAQFSYLPQHFYADNSDNWSMRRLDDRYSTMLAGLNARMLLPVGILSLTASTDILGYSDGVIIDGSYTYPLNFGVVSIAPTVGIQWTDENYNDYYYGIDQSEARASGLGSYSPDSAFSPFAMLTARLNFTESWSAYASARAVFLDPEIYDSPMVEDSTKFAFSLGLMYRF